MDIQDRDLVVTFYRSTGPGGQHKNKTESAVRIKHLPTGITVTATESRSQAANRKKAMERLHERLAARNRRRKKRIPTAPTKASKERRLTEKKKAGEKKKGREKVET